MLRWVRRLIHRHKFVEVDRYRMFITGEDRIDLICEICGKEDYEYTLDTYLGRAKATGYKEYAERWEERNVKRRQYKS